MWDAVEDARFAGGELARHSVDALRAHVPLREAINAFWLQAENRRGPTWTDHRDINDVMLATSLAPDGWLVLPPLHRGDHDG